MEALRNKQCLQCGTLCQAEYCCSACEIVHLGLKTEVPVGVSEWAYLDKPEFRNLYYKQNSDYNLHLFVEGLHCSSCVHLLEKIPDYVEGVFESRVQMSRSLLSLKAEEGVALSKIQGLLKAWGYESRFLDSEELSLDHFEKENRKYLKKIAVAGACAGNIMLFIVPVYAGLEGPLKTIFNWMSFFLFLPILFYSALDFYQGAWNGLRFKVINVDLPITIALWGGFLLSTVNLLRGQEGLYYDSTASFLFLILSARYLLRRVQQNYLKPLRIFELLSSQKIQMLKDGVWSSVPVGQVPAGSVIALEKDQVLPFDAELLKSEALLDLSVMTGESFPQKFSPGMSLMAGSKVLQNNCEFKTVSSLQDSRLSKLLLELEEGSLQKTAMINLTDRLSQKLILVVFAAAVVFFLAYFQINFQQAFDRSLALIVLACPCALAFGAPLTYGLALRSAQKKGILIKNGLSLEKILKVQNVFFDKTGTLTQGDLKLAFSNPEVLSLDVKSIILSLESQSFHPVAFALRKEWSQVTIKKVNEFQEILGQGLQGRIDGENYRLQFLSESVHENYLGVTLLKNDEVLCRLYFEDPVRPEAAQVVQDLSKQNLNCFILSGDRNQRVREVAKICGIKPENAFAEKFPEDKLNIIQKHSQTCMIGDGANDALSLNSADVGIVMKGSLPLSLKAADVYFLRGGLKPFQDFLNLSKQTQKVLHRNLFLSLAYNSIGGVLALMGFINPFWAAVLMPLSSSLIVLSTLWGFK